MKVFMSRIKLILMDISVWLLDKLVLYWNANSGEEPEHIGFPIYVVYVNDEIEVLPLEREIKIGLDGTVYFKDPVKRKWIPYPEIVEIVFTASRMDNADL